MNSGLFNLSAWVTPFGFVKAERESESKVAHGFEGSLVGLLGVYGIVLGLDLLTLPLAIFWLGGVGRHTTPPNDNR